ncbi:MAG: DUF5106 domain-containing protein [Rikenellaceae bacterium]
MKIKFRVPLTLCLSIIFMVGCVGRGGSKGRTEQNSTERKATFTLPAVPSQIVDRQARMDYTADHFWDNYNFTDSLLLADKETTGQAFATYASLLGALHKEKAEESIVKLLSKSFEADSAAFAIFAELFERYFHEPNSPFLNEELYIPALRFIVEDERIEPINKLRSQFHLEMALKNRVGAEATDFSYLLKDGSRGSLHKIRADYTILFFNNPDCHDCKRVKEYFAASEIFNSLTQQGKLKILSLYPDDSYDLWAAAEYPAIMINGYDKEQSITQGQLYDLKAIPTLYLLDADKKVILKDTTIETIEHFLNQVY